MEKGLNGNQILGITEKFPFIEVFMMRHRTELDPRGWEFLRDILLIWKFVKIRNLNFRGFGLADLCHIRIAVLPTTDGPFSANVKANRAGWRKQRKKKG